MTLTVVIVTYNRPDCVARNLAALAAQEPPPEQVIVVDASVDDRTAGVAAGFPDVRYVRCAGGRGNMTRSRNEGLAHATGEVIAFLDDDAFPHAGWSAALREAYLDPNVDGVAGRSLNGLPGEATAGVDQIGTFTPGGRPLGFFAADPGRRVDVQHQIGCNMSFRAALLARLGGFRDDFTTGSFAICEETDLCLRARRLGARFVFEPRAVVDHIAAPQTGGRRFSPSYSYCHARNNLLVLVRNFGVSAQGLRNVAEVGGFFVRDAVRRIASGLAHLASGLAGLAAGLALGVFYRIRDGAAPVRAGPDAERIRVQLSRHRDQFTTLRESASSCGDRNAASAAGELSMEGVA